MKTERLFTLSLIGLKLYQFDTILTLLNLFHYSLLSSRVHILYTYIAYLNVR